VYAVDERGWLVGFGVAPGVRAAGLLAAVAAPLHRTSPRLAEVAERRARAHGSMCRKGGHGTRGWAVVPSSSTGGQRMGKVANRNGRGFGWEGRFATPADFPPRIVARTGSYTYAAKVRALALVQGPFCVIRA
jgi:hypothetical protein